MLCCFVASCSAALFSFHSTPPSPSNTPPPSCQKMNVSNQTLSIWGVRLCIKLEILLPPWCGGKFRNWHSCKSVPLHAIHPADELSNEEWFTSSVRQTIMPSQAWRPPTLLNIFAQIDRPAEKRERTEVYMSRKIWRLDKLLHKSNNTPPRWLTFGEARSRKNATHSEVWDIVRRLSSGRLRGFC